MNRREALTIIGTGVAFLATPKALPLFSMSAESVDNLRDAYEVSGPWPAFLGEGFEAPTWGDNGSISGIVRVSKVDRSTNTIWLEAVPNLRC
jgi:hypothetical protein